MLRIIFFKTIMLAVSLLCWIALAGCEENNVVDWFVGGKRIKIAFAIDGMTNENGNKTAVSRGFIDDDGNEMLHSVHFIFFNETTGAYMTHTSVSYTADCPTPEGNVFQITADINENTRYKTLIVGNAVSFTPTGYDSYDSYIMSLQNLSYSEMRTKLFVSGASNASSYPLAGEWVDGSGKPSSFIISDGSVNGSVKFTRTVCRVDIINSIPVEDLADISVQLCNARTGAYVFHDNILHDEAQNYAKTTPYSSEVKDEARWVSLPFSATGLSSCSLYFFPNSSAQPQTGDLQTTCLLLKGRYKGSATYSYYRFNIVRENNAQSLHANHSYKITLQNVEKQGKQSATLAWSDEQLITFEYLNYQPNNMGEVIIEGFDSTPKVNPNGVISTPMEIRVKCTRNDEFDVYARNNFDSNVDAFVSTSQVMQEGEKMKSIASFANNKNAQMLKLNPNPSAVFFLQVFRTGPGDEDFTGHIELVAYPKGADITDANTEPAFISKPIKVRVTTNCLLEEVLLTPDKFSGFGYKADNYGKVQADTDAEKNDTYIWYPSFTTVQSMPTGVKAYVVSDRNMSAAPRWQNGQFVKAFYYNEESSVKCGGTNHAYNAYSKILPPVQFACAHGCHIQSRAYNWMRDSLTQGIEGDPFWFAAGSQTKWHRDLPVPIAIGSSYNTFNEFTVSPESKSMRVKTCFDNNIAVSKNRLFLISDFKKNGKYVGCYLQTGPHSRQIYYGWNPVLDYTRGPYCAPNYLTKATGTVNGMAEYRTDVVQWTSSSGSAKTIETAWCYTAAAGSKTSVIPVGGITMGHKFMSYYTEYSCWMMFCINRDTHIDKIRGSFEVGSPRPWRPILNSEWPSDYDKIYTPR